MLNNHKGARVSGAKSGCDIYHGNPRVFSEDEICNPRNKNITAGELYRKTIKREEEIKSLGFNLVVMWELDWDNSEKNNV